MIGAAAVAVAGLLAWELVVVTRLVLGPAAWHLAPGVLALAVGAGLLSRVRLPYLGACLGLAVLGALHVPLLVGVRELAGPGAPAAWAGCLLVIAPLGLLLGRQLAPLCEGGLVSAGFGAAAAALAVSAGAGAWWPPTWLGTPLAAVLLASLAEAARHRAGTEAAPADEAPASWAALPLAAAASCVWLALARHVPAYVEPTGDVGAESLLALLLPGLVVALPARVVFVRPGRARRLGLSLALLALAWGAWSLAHSLSLHAFHDAYKQRTWEWRGLAQRGEPWLDEWRVWLLIMGGGCAAGLGLGLGAAGRRAAGPAALGLGAAWLVQEWVASGSGFASQQLVVLAAGLAAVGAAWPWHRLAWLATPLAAVALALLPLDRRDEVLRLRRIGEMEATLARRDRLGEVLLFGTGAADNVSPDGREAWARSFTGDRRRFLPPGEAPTVFEPDPSDPSTNVRFHGLRLVGRGAHEGTAPLGPEGSVGRMLRVFHRDGAALVLGHGAELLAAELAALDPGRDLHVGSDLRLGDRITRLLLDLADGPPPAGDHGDDVDAALAHAPADGWRLVALAPERARWPLAGRVVAADVLARLRDDLAPDGRCLVWLDTRDLDARALGARLAAFGAAFGARSLALVEPRELRPPLVLLVGWRDDAGRPAAGELAARAPTDWRAGVRPILDDAGDLACLVLFDGAGLQRLAAEAPVQRAARPIPPGRGSTGWAALAHWARLGVEPGDEPAGLPAARATPWPLVAALAPFDRRRFDPDRPAGTMSVQVAEDVDWAAFERLVEALAEVRRTHPEHPLLPVIAAALLEPLAVHEEFTRFAWAWERLAADGLPGWRLPAMLAEVAGAMRQDELAAQAAERAKAWAAGRSSGN